jgi:hypothetical protein
MDNDRNRLTTVTAESTGNDRSMIELAKGLVEKLPTIKFGN